MRVPRLCFRGLAAIFLLFASLGVAQAHHGWRWTDDGQFELTGKVERAVLGNPHGVLTVDADGAKWQVEVGQPWRNEQAGLSDDLLAKGATLTLIGKRSADSKEKRMKAERVIIGGKNFDLYPERLPDGKK